MIPDASGRLPRKLARKFFQDCFPRFRSQCAGIKSVKQRPFIRLPHMEHLCVICVVCGIRKGFKIEILVLERHTGQRVRVPHGIHVDILPTGNEPGTEVSKSIVRIMSAQRRAGRPKVAEISRITVYFKNEIPVRDIVQRIVQQIFLQPVQTRCPLPVGECLIYSFRGRSSVARSQPFFDNSLPLREELLNFPDIRSLPVILAIIPWP